MCRKGNETGALLPRQKNPLVSLRLSSA